MDQDFQENLEDFVTLDELEEDEGDAYEPSDAAGEPDNKGMRVISIMGFNRGYNFLQELLELAKPFGKVEKHLVLDRRAEAYIQFEEEAQAIAMHKFYNRNVIAKVCGRQVKIGRSMGYSTIQTGPGRVLYIGQLPNLNYSDEDVLKLAEPFGMIKKYSMHRRRRECFIEMMKSEDAEKMAEVSKETPLKLLGRRLLVYVSRKYRVLRNNFQYPNKAKRSSSRSPPQSPQRSDEPPAKKMKEAEPEEEEVQKTDQNSAELPEASEEKVSEDAAAAEAKVQKEEDKQEEMDTSSNQIEQTEAPPPADIKPRPASLPLPPYDPEVPIGVEHVKMGYYCRICFLFYSNKDTAMKSHCSSQAHYDKLQKHLEKEQTKAVKKSVKTAP